MQKSIVISLLRTSVFVTLLTVLVFVGGRKQSDSSFFSLNSNEASCDPSIADDKCTYVQQSAECNDIAEMVDYLELYYCHIYPNNRYILFVLGFGFWGFLLFILLSGTAETYFVPVLEQIVRDTNMSSDVAGVTLLSLANGGPDIASQISSLTADELSLALASVLGAGLFVLLLVLGIIILVARPDLKGQKIQARPFNRNTIVYLVSLLYLCFLLFNRSINIVESLVFPIIYAIFVFVVILSNKQRSDTLLIPDVDDIKDPDFDSINTSLLEKNEHKPSSVLRFLFSTPDWEDKSSTEKVFYVLESPFTLLRNLSIARIGDEPAFFFKLAVPIFFPLFLIYKFGFHEISIGGINLSFFILTPCLSYLLWIILDHRNSTTGTPRPSLLWLSLAFLGSCLWLVFAADELVALLRTLGLIFSISPSILGVTVLAFGNSAADLVANVFVSKSDLELAVTACLSGPLLNFLIGTGLGIIPLTLKHSFVFEIDTAVDFTVMFLVFSLVVVLVLFKQTKYVPGKISGVILISLYVVYMIGSLVIEIFKL
ncbi:hypothetical protein GEMRC1_010676 [Eukaryota sp. GEM-RC1]